MNALVIIVGGNGRCRGRYKEAKPVRISEVHSCEGKTLLRRVPNIRSVELILTITLLYKLSYYGNESYSEFTASYCGSTQFHLHTLRRFLRDGRNAWVDTYFRYFVVWC